MRILHGLPRFSEDLDFILKAPDPDFQWKPYLKGRDWYDLSWYVKKRVNPNLPHLQAALFQHGPWQGQSMTIDQPWVKNALKRKVTTINWTDAAADVTRFLKAIERQSLKLWSERFFVNKVEKV